MTERPLVAFTLLAQAAVGAFITLGAVESFAHGLTAHPGALALTGGMLAAIGPAMSLALLVSLLHLGARGAAWRALANLRTSWLSREILLGLLFAGGATLLAVLRSAGATSGRPLDALAAAAALCGVAMVYAMSRVYRLRTVPGWDTPRTTVSFFSSALLLGTLAVGAGLALLPGVPAEPLAGPLRWIGAGAAVGLGAEFALSGRGRYGAVRRGLLFASLALCAATLAAPGRATPALAAAFALALAAQVLGRYLFYVDGPRREL